MQGQVQIIPDIHEDKPEMVLSDAVADSPDFVAPGITLDEFGTAGLNELPSQVGVLQKLGQAIWFMMVNLMASQSGRRLTRRPSRLASGAESLLNSSIRPGHLAAWKAASLFSNRMPR